MEIVRMSAEHIEKIAELEGLCFSAPWSKNSLMEQLGNNLAYFVTAMERDEVLGYGGMHCIAGEAYIDNIAVFPLARNKGVGLAIVERLIKEAKTRKAEFISLEVRESNPAVSLYKRAGFLMVGKRPGFYSTPREDALIMTLTFT